MTNDVMSYTCIFSSDSLLYDCGSRRLQLSCLAVHAMEAHFVLHSTHAWSAAGKLREYSPLYTHAYTLVLPEVFGCALLELAQG